MLHIIPQGENFVFGCVNLHGFPQRDFGEYHTKLSVLIGDLTHGAATARYHCPGPLHGYFKKTNKQTKNTNKQK